MDNRPIVIVKRKTFENGEENYRLFMWCPGCEDLHAVNNLWTWDGDFKAPTISPSILVDYGIGMKICHSFVTAGEWNFLNDCTHALAGQEVPMVPIPEGTRGMF